MEKILTPEQFCITVDYDKNAPNPEKVFKGIAKMIEGLQIIDNQLASCIDSRIEPLILLDDIEHGSIKVFLKSFLKTIPDEGLKNCDIRRIVGEFLVKGKYALLTYMEGKEAPEKEEIVQLQERLANSAKETGVSALNCYTPPNTEGLLTGLKRIGESTDIFRETDNISLVTDKDVIRINKSFKVTTEDIETICNNEEIKNTNTLILKIKQADFLGSSQWEFKLGTSTVKANILDEDWLLRYRERQINLIPGDALKAKVEVTAYYDNNHNLAKEKYVITKVISVVKNIQESSSESLL